MYLDNEKISPRQMKRLLVFNIFSISGLIIPRIAAASARRDGLISVFLGLLFALIFIIFIGFIVKNTSGNFMKYSKDKCGNLITFIIGAFYVIKYFASLVFCGRLFSEVIKETLLEDADMRFIILMLLLISAYSASKGFEVRARITEILYFIVLIPLVLFLLIGLKSVDLSNLLPLFTEPKGDIISGGYRVFITFTSLEFMIFSMHYVKEKPVKSSPKGKFSDKQERFLKIFRNSNLNYILNAFIIVGIIDILLYVVTVGILGITDTSSKLWSTINMIQIVDLPGEFLQRHDALIIPIWMLSIFTLTSGFLYYILMISKEMFHLKSQNYMVLPYIILLFIACITPIDTEIYFWYFEKYMMLIGVPASIILPLIVLIIGKIRDFMNKNKEKKLENYHEDDVDRGRLNLKSLSSKSLTPIIIIAIPMLLTGCSDMTEIEDRNFIQSIGLDYENGEIALSLESPDLAAYTGQASSDEDGKEKLINVIRGNDFFQIEEEYLNEANKRMDFSHLQVIIFGREFIENKVLYYEFLEYAQTKYEISRNTLIVMSNTSAEDIMDMNSKLDGGLGNFLFQLYRINVINNGREEIKLQNLLLSKNEKNLVPKIPIVVVEEDKILLAGAGFIQDGKLAYEADLDENEYINIARGFGSNSRIFIEDKSGNIKYVLKINRLKRNITLEENDGKPFIIYRIEGDGELEKGLDVSGYGFDEENKGQIDKINLECNQYIHDEVVKLIGVITKEEQVDVLNVYRELYENKNLWLKYKDKQGGFLKDLDYVVEVDIGI